MSNTPALGERPFSGIGLGEQSRQLLALAREFARDRLRPGARERDQNEESVDPEIMAEMGDLGFFGLRVPEEYDGLGLDVITYLRILEELAFGDPCPALSVSVHNSLPVEILCKRGTEEQRRAWLPLMATGEVLAAFSLSEAGAGSDAASLLTQADSDGEGGWILNGEKAWVTNGAAAGLTLMFARTDQPGDRRRSKGIGAFLVPGGLPGLSAGKKERKMGQRGSETVTMSLEDVRLGPEHLVGESHKGFQYALESLEGGRLGIAALALGIAASAAEEAFRYSAEREQFGQAVRHFQGLEWILGEMSVKLEATRGLLERAARARELGDVRARRLSSAVKLFASEAAGWITRRAVQVHGGYGYSREYAVERMFRDSRVTEIYEGANEIHRSLAARLVYRERNVSA